MSVGKKQCTKCKRMISCSEFCKAERYDNGLKSWCKECNLKYYKKWAINLKREVMTAFGGICVHVENGIQCSKNAINNLDDLELSHPNNDGEEHRNLISNGHAGVSFYRELKKLNWNTSGFVVEVRCKKHHRILDKSGEKSYLYKEGLFNNQNWLEKKYKVMTSRQIADLCSVSHMTILRRMRKFNILRRGNWPRKTI